MPEAQPSDVDGVIETGLSDSEISSYIDDAEFDASQAISNYTTELTAAERKQLEKYYAALLIAESKSRQVSESSVGGSSLVFEGDTVAWLRRMVHRRDPSDSLAYQRDADRTINTS